MREMSQPLESKSLIRRAKFDNKLKPQSLNGTRARRVGGKIERKLSPSQIVAWSNQSNNLPMFIYEK